MYRSEEYERILGVLERADHSGPFTAREIHELLVEHGENLGGPHRIATILGRRSERDEITVIREQPYRYDFPGRE